MCKGTFDTEAYIRIKERHMLPSRQQIFSLEVSECFSREMAQRLDYVMLPQHGFIDTVCMWLTGLSEGVIWILLKMNHGQSDNGDHGPLSS